MPTRGTPTPSRTLTTHQAVQIMRFSTLQFDESVGHAEATPPAGSTGSAGERIRFGSGSRYLTRARSRLESIDQAVVFLGAPHRNPNEIGQRRGGGKGADDQAGPEQDWCQLPTSANQHEVGGRLTRFETERAQLPLQPRALGLDALRPIAHSAQVGQRLDRQRG